MESALRVNLEAVRSKHLPPIKRGCNADVYLTSSGQLLYNPLRSILLIACFRILFINGILVFDSVMWHASMIFQKLK